MHTAEASLCVGQACKCASGDWSPGVWLPAGQQASSELSRRALNPPMAAQGSPHAIFKEFLTSGLSVSAANVCTNPIGEHCFPPASALLGTPTCHALRALACFWSISP